MADQDSTKTIEEQKLAAEMNNLKVADDDNTAKAKVEENGAAGHSAAVPETKEESGATGSDAPAAAGNHTAADSGAAPEPTLDDAIIHPLQNGWTLYFDNPRKRTSVDTWGSHIKKVMEFGTVEDFWRLYNNIMKASTLDHGSNYHLFKEGIEPKWEDPANERGGQWTLIVPHRERKDKLDELWLWTMLASIGEMLETEGEEEQVCGCVASIRKSQDRITIWTRNAAMEGRVRAIGEKWKRLLDLPKTTTISYQAHADSMKNRSVSRYEV